MQPIVILKTGRYRDAGGKLFEITPAILEDIALSTPPSSAPLVKGHPLGEEPALGWVKSLSAEGGKLKAVFEGVDKNLEAEIRRGAFKNISASFFLPSSESNPVPGHHCLRHAAALGAARPAVPGLGTLQQALGLAPCSFSLPGAGEIYGEGGEEFVKEAFEELRVRVQRLEADLALRNGEYEELCKLRAVEEALSQWAKIKTCGEEDRLGISQKALALVNIGHSPEDAVAAFAEHLPQRVSFLGTLPLAGMASFSEDGVRGREFARKKAEYEASGLSSVQAYDKAEKEMGGL